MKQCSKCLQIKHVEDFNKCSFTKDELQYRCKQCEKQYKLQNKPKISTRAKEYYLKNKERLSKKYKKLYRENPTKFLNKNKNWASNNKSQIQKQKRTYYLTNKFKLFKYKYSWNKKNKDKLAKYQVEHRKRNPNAMIAHRLRNRIRTALKHNLKSTSTEKLLGCSFEELKIWLISKFSNNMSWEKFQSGEIVIDHIKPCCAFDLSQPKEQAQCFHYTNLQPLWKKDNLNKGKEDKKRSILAGILPIPVQNLPTPDGF